MARICTALLLLIALTACRSGMPPKQAPPETWEQGFGPPPEGWIAAPPARPMEYRFAVGDDLSVDVWKEPDLTTELRVLVDGTIAPQLIGSVRIAGLTIDETNELLRERYREYIKEPVVSVRVTAIHSDRVFVLGEVETPQAVEITGPTTLMQAIAQAEGFLENFASKCQIRIVRVGPDGQPVVHVVDGDAVLAGRAPDPMMQRGDVVWVPARGVTNWARNLGQALAPFSLALGAAGSTAAIYNLVR